MGRLQSILDRTARWLLWICVVTGIPGALLFLPCYWIWGKHSYPLAVPIVLLVIALVTGAHAIFFRKITRGGHTLW